ncbi:hypothetical protein FPV67DRAFT_913948 [Lyophyllum atratum]|nr:hypothetical protein FPV67DRAFT_913948 [Lyophyllum atratum]
MRLPEDLDTRRLACSLSNSEPATDTWPCPFVFSSYCWLRTCIAMIPMFVVCHVLRSVLCPSFGHVPPPVFRPSSRIMFLSWCLVPHSMVRCVSRFVRPGCGYPTRRRINISLHNFVLRLSFMLLPELSSLVRWCGPSTDWGFLAMVMRRDF